MSLAWALFYQAEAEGGGPPIWYTLIFYVAIFGILYLLLLRPQMRQQKEQRQLINNLKKGDRVITSGGLWGEIEAVEDRTVRLKLGEKTKVVVSRSAITGMQQTPDKEKETK